MLQGVISTVNPGDPTPFVIVYRSSMSSYAIFALGHTFTAVTMTPRLAKVMNEVALAKRVIWIGERANGSGDA